MSIFEHYQQRYEAHKEEEYSIQEYLELCKKDRQQSDYSSLSVNHN